MDNVKMSSNILYFCKLIAMGYDEIEAITLSHKKIDNYVDKVTITDKLLSHPKVLGEIDRQRELLFNPVSIRRRLISLHAMCMDFSPSDCFDIVIVYDKDGNEVGTRVKIRPIANWSPIAKKLFKGFDRNGYPTFREPEKAMGELSRLYGFYKDTQSTVEDTDAVINGALGIDEVMQEIDELDSVELDDMLRPVTDGRPLKDVITETRNRVEQAHNFSIPTFDSSDTNYKDIKRANKRDKTREWRKKNEVKENNDTNIHQMTFDELPKVEECTVPFDWVSSPEDIAKIEDETRAKMQQEKELLNKDE